MSAASEPDEKGVSRLKIEKAQCVLPTVSISKAG
jgi:hypothetical protein